MTTKTAAAKRLKSTSTAYLTKDTRADLAARLARIEGHVRAVSKMLDEDESCDDLMTQLAAVRAATTQVIVKLFEGHKAVDYTFKCAPVGIPPGGGSNDRKPNITSARPGLYVWGSDPAKKHWVDWNGSVKLTAAESINPHPTPSNGQCAFNVEYYEKETNGVATGNFKNKLYSDANERAINGPFALTASELKSIVTQPYLDSGAHGFKVVLDADGNVNETSEADNSGSIRYHLEGRCDSKPGTSPAAAATKH